jgi:hypothetical protein
VPTQSNFISAPLKYVALVISSTYTGYVPDFGLLEQISNTYETPIESLHGAWDGFWIVMTPIGLYLLYYFTKKLLIARKRKKVLQFIHQFSITDPFWNAAVMKNIATSMFIDVQYAWMKLEFRNIVPWLSDSIKTEWQHLLATMQKNDYAFFVSSIDIKRVTIIAAEDYMDDAKDQFKVEITGYIKRYVKIKTSNQLALHQDPSLKAFTDIYTFIRQENQWKLLHIQHEANIGDILFAKKPVL